MIKRRRLGLFRAKTTLFYDCNFFFFNSAYIKTTSFWTTRVQNDVVLNQLSHIQNDVVWVSDSLFKTTSFWFLIALNDVVFFCI